MRPAIWRPAGPADGEGACQPAGRNAHEPVAVISRATTKSQRVLETTLANAVADVERSGIEAPALIVIGEAVRLRAGLDWLSAIGEGRTLDPDPLRTKTKRESA